ncbi:MAG: hypothetical protein EHM93_16465 [Bacteroidales bacterium]|nr:MAG: hypothetical protein EHM93_16465 [Bacteroidales bacterium]
MRYYIICIITAISVNAFSQTLKLKVQDKTVELKSSSANLPIDNIVDLIKDKNQNDILIYSNYLGVKDIKEGNFKGQQTGIFKEGVVFKDGSKFEFSEKETYICNIENSIYSEKIDFLNSVKNINVYHINNNSLIKSPNSITIQFNNSFERIPNCEFLIFSNMDETVGDEVKIYDKNLNIINTYKPFDTGFSGLLYNSIGENIFIISTPSIYSNSNKKFKLSIINTQNNFSINEINYLDKIEPQRLISLDNNLVLISVGKIMLISRLGHLLWSKNLNVSPTDFSTVGCESEGKLFVIAEGAVVCMNILDGSVLWRISLKDIYPTFEKPKSIKNEYYMSYVTIDFKILVSLKMICIISAKKEHNLKDNSITYSSKNLTLIDYEGKIIKHIPLTSTVKSSINAINYIEGRVKTCQLLIEDNGFRVINDRKIEKYEK